MGSTDLVVASRAVAVRDYPPLPGPPGNGPRCSSARPPGPVKRGVKYQPPPAVVVVVVVEHDRVDFSPP